MFTKAIIGIIIGLSSVLYATPFKLNSNAISHIYFPINDNKSKWYIVEGSPFHKGSDTYADDWNLKNGYTAGIESASSCDRDRGAEIISSFTGKIILADKDNDIGVYGKEVIIQSTEDSSFAIRYAHLDNVYVTDGIVKVGDVIGTVGDSGADCAHLHLVLYKNLDTTALNRLKKGHSPKSLTGSADKYAAKFYSDATSGGNTNVTSNQLSITDLRRDIQGENPTPYELNKYIFEKCKVNNIPPIILKAILLQEGQPGSKWRQFSPDSSYNHETIVYGTDANSYGLGLFQVTYRVDSNKNFLSKYSQDDIKNTAKYWKTNVDKAVDILLTKWKENIGSFTGVDANPLIIENWYYPIAWYNGRGTPAKEYVDNIYQYMTNSSSVSSKLSNSSSNIFGYYQFINDISMPYIIDGFNIPNNVITGNGPTKYTLKQIVDNGGELHIWDKDSSSSNNNIYDNYSYYGSDDNSGTNEGIFDGAGSLVSPKDDCWGCNKDEARMQPHTGTGSTVVFQWWHDSNVCSQIELTSDRDIDVLVRAKGWQDHLTKKEFKVTLGTDPITLKRPNENAKWTTLAITSTSSIDEMTPIYAHCKTPQDKYHNGNRKVSNNPSLVDVTYNYFWTGTGSLISKATARHTYGVTKDDAVTFSTKNSLTSFQWDITNCSSIRITNNGKNIDTKAIVDIKPWYNDEWETNKCTSLPCTINKNSGSYYIIKVKTAPNAIADGSYLNTQCIY